MRSGDKPIKAADIRAPPERAPHLCHGTDRAGLAPSSVPCSGRPWRQSRHRRRSNRFHAQARAADQAAQATARRTANGRGQAPAIIVGFAGGLARQTCGHPLTPVRRQHLENVLRTLGQDQPVQITALADRVDGLVRHSSATCLFQKSPRDMQKTRRRSPATAASRSQRYGARWVCFACAPTWACPHDPAITRIFLRLSIGVVTCRADLGAADPWIIRVIAPFDSSDVPHLDGPWFCWVSRSIWLPWPHRHYAQTTQRRRKALHSLRRSINVLSSASSRQKRMRSLENDGRGRS